MNTQHFSSPTHLSTDTIADYFANSLSETAMLDAEEHFATCDACALRSQKVLAVGALIQQWSAPVHGEAELQARLVAALEAARKTTTVAAIRTRLAAWAERFAGQAEAAVRVVLDAPGQAARVLTEGVEGLTRPGATWQFAQPQPATLGPIRGTARRGPPRQTVVTAGDAGGTTAKLAVSGERGEVTVRLDGVPLGSEPPLVLLVRTDRTAGQAPAEPILAAPEPSPGSDAWVARFEGLGQGSYLVLFEPRAE
jgi:hypothetical protein